MASTLVPCASCARHVRASDRACPFCGGSLEAPASVAANVPAGVRLGRAAIFAVGVAVASSVAACEMKNDTDAAVAEAGPTDDGSVMALYGAPVADAAPAPDVADGGPVARYGAPPAPEDFV